MIVITFFTHHAALMTHKTLVGESINSKMAPVPRRLSSSCGSCVIAEIDEIDLSLLDEDTEAVYIQKDGKYEQIYSAE